MHSSRMRTGRALTVSGGGGVHPRRNFLGENKLGKKKEKKISDTPPQNLGQTPPPPNLGQTPPPENLEQTTPPPGVDRQTPVNLLPWPNFVAAGNYTIPNLDLGDKARKQFNETSG